MKSSEKFWDKTAEDYAKSPIKNVPAYQESLARTKAYLSEDDNVLEVGCGTGSTALLLAGSVKHITATDISSNMIAIGWRKAQEQKVANITFARATPFDDIEAEKPFDAVLAFNVLHLLEDTPKALRRLHDLLKPGGLLISKTVCLAEENRLWRVLIFLMQRVGFAPFVKYLKVSELEDCIADQGFEIIETGSYPSYSRGRFIVARKL
ncbi:class I SAM-dependent methyltransferase [Pelagibius litoralis]|uniref:Class I SAM-dependent methyltransferase n=1 Tax=Pelagibius litoralis TaxID=374515 RepID=A0A967C4C7_9PROT|nr:class I SAM-dependent methyltransferase [Pelagibius litoralis]NIA68379.1 class I SAM-dependent methyltransferase [Pelagibius litoralis]